MGQVVEPASEPRVCTYPEECCKELSRVWNALKVTTYRPGMGSASDQVARLKAERDAALQRIEALEKYTQHKGSCRSLECQRCHYNEGIHVNGQAMGYGSCEAFVRQPCTCGLAALTAGQEPT